MMWLQFIICAALILIFGSRLTGYADVISKKGIFSAGLMGVLFLSVITSCPELSVSLGSVTLVNAPDLATGDLIGAVIINVFAILVLGILYRKGSILAGQKRSNILSAALTILMLGFIIGFLSLRALCGLRLGIFNIGADSIILGLIYITGISIIYRHETRMRRSAVKEKVEGLVWIKFCVSAAVIIISGFWLARIGKTIADVKGWNEMHVGLVFIAIATTLPEFVVSLTALRLNSVDMAVGNLLGSNFFNLFILFILDIFFRRGEFLSFVSLSNIYPAFFAMLLMVMLLIKMLKRS